MNLRTFAQRVYRLRRLVVYTSLVQAIMVGVLFLDRFGWWYLLLSPVGIFILNRLHHFDKKYGLPMESNIVLKDAPEWVDTKFKIDFLYNLLGGPKL